MLHYTLWNEVQCAHCLKDNREAEETGSEVMLVNPAHTSEECSSCGLIQKKSLAERWHSCSCGVSMHSDLNAAINILTRATGRTPESNTCGEEIPTHYKSNEQISSMKQEATLLT
jgi:hypothetical protein